MRTKLILSILIIFLSLLTKVTFAQKDYSLSVFYKYSLELNPGTFSYPLGLGSTISRNISDKLIFTVGIEYAHLNDEFQNQITPPVYRTREVFKESIFSLTTGMSYPIIENKIIIKIGGGLVSSYFYNNWEFYRYTVPNDLLDDYQKKNNDAFGLGIKGKIDFQFPLSNGIGIFIQPAYTYYLIGEAKKEQFFTGSTGLSYAF